MKSFFSCERVFCYHQNQGHFIKCTNAYSFVLGSRFGLFAKEAPLFYRPCRAFFPSFTTMRRFLSLSQIRSKVANLFYFASALKSSTNPVSHRLVDCSRKRCRLFKTQNILDKCGKYMLQAVKGFQSYGIRPVAACGALRLSLPDDSNEYSPTPLQC